MAIESRAQIGEHFFTLCREVTLNLMPQRIIELIKNSGQFRCRAGNLLNIAFDFTKQRFRLIRQQVKNHVFFVNDIHSLINNDVNAAG